jgi:polyribonucleotide nucleotidyltransferase
VKDVRDELKEGEQILVKVINIDPQGKVKLSRKAVLREQAGLPPEEPQPPRPPSSGGGWREREGGGGGGEGRPDRRRRSGRRR